MRTESRRAPRAAELTCRAVCRLSRRRMSSMGQSESIPANSASARAVTIASPLPLGASNAALRARRRASATSPTARRAAWPNIRRTSLLWPVRSAAGRNTSAKTSTPERLTSGSVVATDSLAVGTPVPETCGAKDRTDHRSAALVAASRRTLAGPEMINVPCLGLASRARISFRAARARARCPGSSKLNGTWTMPDRGRSASRRALT